jgi:hypothetical protein
MELRSIAGKFDRMKLLLTSLIPWITIGVVGVCRASAPQLWCQAGWFYRPRSLPIWMRFSLQDVLWCIFGVAPAFDAPRQGGLIADAKRVDGPQF